MVSAIIWNSAQIGSLQKAIYLFRQQSHRFRKQVEEVVSFLRASSQFDTSDVRDATLRDRLLGDILIGHLGYRLNSLALSRDRISTKIYAIFKCETWPNTDEVYMKQTKYYTIRDNKYRNINESNVKKFLPVHTNLQEFFKNGLI